MMHDTHITPSVLITDLGTAKARIERAALDLFAAGSVDGTSTKAIAARANVSEGLIYRHYKSKEDLAQSLMRLIHIRLTDMIETAADMPLRDAITFIVQNYCRAADEDWALFRYHILHLHRFAGLMHAYGKSPHSVASRFIAEQQKLNIIKNTTDSDILSAMALGIVLQCAQAKVLGAISGPLITHHKTFEASLLAIFDQA